MVAKKAKSAALAATFNAIAVEIVDFQLATVKDFMLEMGVDYESAPN